MDSNKKSEKCPRNSETLYKKSVTSLKYKFSPWFGWILDISFLGWKGSYNFLRVTFNWKHLYIHCVIPELIQISIYVQYVSSSGSMPTDSRTISYILLRWTTMVGADLFAQGNNALLFHVRLISAYLLLSSKKKL